MAGDIGLPIKAAADIDTPASGKYNLFLNSADSDQLYKKSSAGVSTPVIIAGAGTVTSVAQSFTGGLISVAGSPITTSGTLALTVAGTSGGVPYFSSASTWASSGVLAANSILVGGGAGVAPSSITTGTGVVTALGVNVGSAGAFVVFNGALGTPSSGTLTNCTGLVLTTGVTGVLPTANGGTAVNIASAALVLGTASTTAGQLTLSNATNAFTQTLRGTNPTASIIYDLPTTAPTLGQVLSATAPAAGVVTLSWATAASGISIGDAIGNSPVTGSALMAIGGVITQSISYRAQQATPFSTAFGFESHSSGSFSGIYNTSIGYNAGKAITTGKENTIIGCFSGTTSLTTASANTYIGAAVGTEYSGSNNTGVGAYVFYTGAGTGNNNTAVGRSAMGGFNTGSNCSAFGYQALLNGSGNYNSFFGAFSGGSPSGAANTGVGTGNGYSLSSGQYNVLLGIWAGFGISTGSGNVFIGGNSTDNGANQSYSASGTISNSIAIGYLAYPIASNQCVIGSAAYPVNNVYFNGVTHTAPYSVVLNASGGSGTNVAGASLTDAGGKGTGSGTPGTLVFKTSTTLGSGTTLQSLVSRLTISGGAVTTDASTATWADALDFVFGTTTGTKIGTGTTQKIGFWNATPLAQQTTASAASTFVANTSLIANDTATFDGYTLGQVVKILRNLGILA